MNNFKTDDLNYQRKRHLLNCVDRFENRFKLLAIGRWRDRKNDLIVKEEGAHTLMRRLRIRFLRKAVDLYIDGVNFSKKV